MKQKIALIITALLMSTGLMLAVPHHVRADCADGSSIQSGIDCAPAASQKQNVPNGIKTTVNTLLFVVGIAAVIVIIIGGLRFILAGGNAQTITSARESVLYAVIGIVVALLAYAIVNFVLGQFSA